MLYLCNKAISYALCRMQFANEFYLIFVHAK